MAIKGYSKGRSIKALDALTGGPIPKRYFIVNIGIRQLAKVKEASLLLRKEDTLDFRVIPIRMHGSECNWVKLRDLLGKHNPHAEKQLEALDKLKDLMVDTGGIVIKERRITKEDKGKTSNVFEFTSLELFEAGDDHPGVSTFSAYTKMQLGFIKPLLTTEEEEKEFLHKKRDIPDSVINSLELPEDYEDYDDESNVEEAIREAASFMNEYVSPGNTPKTLKEWAGKLSKDFLFSEGIQAMAGERLYKHYNNGTEEKDVLGLWKMVNFEELKRSYGRSPVNDLKDMLMDMECEHASR